MSSITTVIASNIAVLTAGRSVVAGLGDEHYNFICTPFTASLIGLHFRHVIDHYRCLFGGLDCGAIDYDQRARDPLVEQHTRHALQQLDATVDPVQALQTLTQPNPNLTLSVRLCTAVNSACEAPFEATLHRELVFLHGHTTHHLLQNAVPGE